MRASQAADDRVTLVVTAWRHDTEVLGIIRWSCPLVRDIEEATYVRGVNEILASVDAVLRAFVAERG